jgi:hypothetical protein
MSGNGAPIPGTITMTVRRGMAVSGQKMGMIIILLCGAVLGTSIHLTAVPLPATTTTAATTAATTVFGWCAVLGGLCSPFSLFSLFTLIPYFFSFPFFPALRRVDFFEKMALILNFIKTMKELSVISWEGGVILWVVKLLKKLVSLLLE